MPTEQHGSTASGGSRGWLRRLLAMPNDRPQKVVAVAVLLCLVCSVIVSTAAVALKPVQTANKKRDMQRNILEVAGLLDEDTDIDEALQRLEPRIVDLATGQYVPDIDPASFDQRRAARDPALRVDIDPKADIAKIGSRARYAGVYLVRHEGRVTKIIIPIYGSGLYSTLYGFLAVAPDGNTIDAVSFYEHGETPGLGAQVDNPRWKALWNGKKLIDEESEAVLFEVVKGAVDEKRPRAIYQVDGLAGATLTGNGVTNLVRYWAGENGFGPYLERLRSQRG